MACLFLIECGGMDGVGESLVGQPQIIANQNQAVETVCATQKGGLASQHITA